MIKRFLPIALFVLIATSVLVLTTATEKAEKEEALNVDSAVSAVQVEECEPANPTLKFLSEEWAESHKTIVESGASTGCSNKECFACHISAAPHEPGMQGKHKAEYKKDKNKCLKCHDYDSCNECHQDFRAHAEDRTFEGHGKFLNGRETSSCSGCHLEKDQKFCNDCHTEKGEPPLIEHDDRFAQTHPMFEEADNKPCLDCHTETYCYACHAGDEVHVENWYYSHADRIEELAAKLATGEGKPIGDEDRCITCHTAGHCQKCHKREGLLSSRHEEAWEDNHADKPESTTYLCATCHTPGYCSECHEITLPHDADFAEDHKEQAETLPDTCISCHKPELCLSCHANEKPKDHIENKNWYREHKKTAKTQRKPSRDKKELLKLRRERLAKKRKKKEKIETPKYCNLCHDEQTYCNMCHNLSTAKNSHTKKWEEEHKKTASATELRGCAHCHKMDYCFKKCHSENEQKLLAEVEAQEKLDPKTIPEEEVKEPNHILCTKCHVDNNWAFPGIDGCTECHEDISKENKLAIHMTNCMDCHEPHKWKIGPSFVCVECHEDINDLITEEEHRKKENCSDCHQTHKWAYPRRFAICEDCHRKEDQKISKLHEVDAHERCGYCHGPHDDSVKQPDMCMTCHRDIPGVCYSEPEKTCSDSTCHNFRIETAERKK